METVRKRLQKTMIVIMRKYYKRSHKLLLTRYHKPKNSNGLNRLKSINKKPSKIIFSRVLRGATRI